MINYSEIISVDQDLIDVFSEEADTTQPEAWKKFIPNKIVSKILERLLDALERGKQTDNKSLWIQGSYGTGKTFGSFFLKHILDDNPEEIEKYFQSYDDMQGIWNRLEALRKSGNYLTIYRSSTAHINSPFKFFVEIQYAIKKALQEKGYANVIDGTIYEPIYNKLTHPDSTFNWEKAFENHRKKFIDFKTSQQVIENLTPDNIDLLNRVAEVLEKEQVVIIDDIQGVKEWIKKIIKENNLQGIVFIWDEFSDFFNNSNSVESLQELAHLTTETPFYFILITHKKIEILFKNDKDTQTKISNRFHSFHFEMEPVTAYQLMKKSFIIEKTKTDEWKELKSKLWNKVDRGTTELIIGNAQKKDFKDLIPIHPYSAFLLAKISDQLSSSQRTLSKFLKLDAPNSFYNFIKEYPKDDYFWLTIDTLWDYFFTEDNYELTEPIKDVYHYYESRCGDIQSDEEKRIFKSIMLLIALSKQVPDPLLKASLKNIKLAYYGTSLIDQINTIVENLKTVELIREVPTLTGPEYTILTQTIDDRRLKEIKCTLPPFEKEIKKVGEIGKKNDLFFLPSLDSNKRRVHTNFISLKELKDSRERVEPSVSINQIGIVIVFPLDDKDLKDANRIYRSIADKNKSTIYMVAQTPFGIVNWDKWTEQKAYHQYCKQNNDNQNAVYHETQCRGIIDRWIANLRTTKFKVYQKDEEFEVIGKEGYEKLLSDSIKLIFPEGPETISTTNTLYPSSCGIETVKMGLGISKKKIVEPYKSLLNELKKYDSLNNPDHPLNRAHLMIQNLFQQNQTVCLNDIWNELQKPPYGYIESPICMVLMGTLMKEYSEGYFYSDGVNTSQIVPDKMADFILEIAKLKQGKTNITLSKITAEAETFCILLRDIFDLPIEKSQEPLTVLQEVRNFLKNIGYPIWALKYAISQDRDDDKIIITILNEIESFIQITQENAHRLTISKLKSFNEILEKEKEEIKEYIKNSLFESGMVLFINEKNPKFYDLIKDMKIEIPTLTSQIKNQMMEEVYLWKEDKVTISLDQLYEDFNTIDAINKISNSNERQLDLSIEKFLQWYQANSKLPLFMLMDPQDPDIYQILYQMNKYFNEQAQLIQKKGDLDLSQLIKTKLDTIKRALKEQHSALKFWIKKYHDEDLDDLEIQEIFLSFPNSVRITNTNEIDESIKKILKDLTKRKVIKELLDKWSSITKSKSAILWSNDHKIPIQWILEDENFSRLINCINQPQEKNIDELKWAINFIKSNKTKLEVLNDQDHINQKFLIIALGEFQNLVQNQTDIKNLKEYLLENCSSDVFSWHFRPSEIKQLVTKWITSRYEDKTYPSVIEKIKDLDDTKIKKILIDLAKDPLIGSRFLSRRH